MKDNLNKKGKIIENYNATAHFYDARYSKIQNEKFKYVLKDSSLERKFILDAGCGTGLFYEYIQKKFEYKNITSFFFLATDISLKMLTIFSSKIKNIKLEYKMKINLILSDMTNLPFRNNTFDSIFSLTSLQNLPSIYEGINETFRVAKNGAEMRFSILKKSLNLPNLISALKPTVKDLKILNKDELEDAILSFNLHKKL